MMKATLKKVREISRYTPAELHGKNIHDYDYRERMKVGRYRYTSSSGGYDIYVIKDKIDGLLIQVVTDMYSDNILCNL